MRRKASFPGHRSINISFCLPCTLAKCLFFFQRFFHRIGSVPSMSSKGLETRYSSGNIVPWTTFSSKPLFKFTIMIFENQFLWQWWIQLQMIHNHCRPSIGYQLKEQEYLSDWNHDLYSRWWHNWWIMMHNNPCMLVSIVCHLCTIEKSFLLLYDDMYTQGLHKHKNLVCCSKILFKKWLTPAKNASGCCIGSNSNRDIFFIRFLT